LRASWTPNEDVGHPMIDFPNITNLCQSTPSKIVLLVIDGLGGLPHPDTGKSELETASTPNLDALTLQSACGLTTPVMPGITPGSGPGHLALFGYDPIKYLIGRGVLEAIGIGVELEKGQVAARGNFCTLDEDGLLVDRRAGRIPTSESAPLVKLLDQIEVPGVEISVYPVQDHRFVLVLRGEGLDEGVTETDPQALSVSPLNPMAITPEAEKTAQAVKEFTEQARETLAERTSANMVLFRGLSGLPDLPDFGETYRLNPAAVAAYPMYRGLAHLAGMKVIPTGKTFNDELDTLEKNFDQHDFFFLHYKPADAAGEDGNFDAKVEALEYIDAQIPRLLQQDIDTLIVAGDHSTPAIMGAHSWHPVPLMVNSSITASDGVGEFSERACANGSIGRISAVNVMTIALSHAGKLRKFGP
jgi:2,3-bisphosphoglycerate-independent phosphoglycerate mutase